MNSKEYLKEYYQKNKDRILAVQKKRRERDKEVIRQKRLDNYRKNRLAILLKQKEARNRAILHEQTIQ